MTDDSTHVLEALLPMARHLTAQLGHEVPIEDLKDELDALLFQRRSIWPALRREVMTLDEAANGLIAHLQSFVSSRHPSTSRWDDVPAALRLELHTLIEAALARCLAQAEA